MGPNQQHILMGNEAIARGLIENGCSLAASYPGTPASEILAAVAAFAKETGVPVHAEWSVNEKVAYEVALANAMTGRRSAVAMKQVGLNVAADPFLRSAYLGVKGGLIVIVADDPGPHSSQTEQDSRFMAMFAKVPVLDPASPVEAKEMVPQAYELSEKYELPVMLRPTTRVCHARQSVTFNPPLTLDRPAQFVKDPGRWCATPQFLRGLHQELNEKLHRLAREDELAPVLTAGDGSYPKTCIIASGVAFAHTWDILTAWELLGKVDVYQVRMPYPLHEGFIAEIMGRYERILVIEETYPVMEMQLGRDRVQGRHAGLVPSAGELTPEVLQGVVEKFLDRPTRKTPAGALSGGVRPTLCAGCGHRAAFYAIRETFPGGIFPGDIGCYTLGMNLGAVDTVHCMGAGISQAAGFYHAYAASGGPVPPIVATIGDSTFFHAGIPALLNAVVSGARFLLVILDNSTTAMTGHQPTPQSGVTVMGEPAPQVFISELVSACGVRWLRQMDPYGVEVCKELFRDADRYIRSPEGGVAVLIARHPCMLDKAARQGQIIYDMEVSSDCIACHHCLEAFECPALYAREDSGQVEIDQGRCVGCGVCAQVCPAGAIQANRKEGS